MGSYYRAQDGLSWSVDATAWPLVVCCQRGRLSDSEFQASMDAAASALDVAERPYVMLMDSPNADLTPTQRRRLHNTSASRAERRKRLCKGIAIVTSSPLTRGCLTALLWLFRPDVPTRAFADRVTAEAWLRLRLNGTTTLFQEPGEALDSRSSPPATR